MWYRRLIKWKPFRSIMKARQSKHVNNIFIELIFYVLLSDCWKTECNHQRCGSSRTWTTWARSCIWRCRNKGSHQLSENEAGDNFDICVCIQKSGSIVFSVSHSTVNFSFTSCRMGCARISYGFWWYMLLSIQKNLRVTKQPN